MIPLAARMRPQKLDELLGQEHIKLSFNHRLPSMIFWGPPGCGKTTLAHILSKLPKVKWIALSGVMGGVKDIRDAVDAAQNSLLSYGKQTCLFIDEIHRLNQSQQDALLPHVENGTLTLIGATTANPSFSINNALLSRCRVFVLKMLSDENLSILLDRALRNENWQISPEAREKIIKNAGGDARAMLCNLEIHISHPDATMGERVLHHDKKGDSHYDVTSAFIKSMRASNTELALAHLARLIESGDDPLFVLRRMIIFASEDIGNADPQAILIATAALQAFRLIGLPEGYLPLTQAVMYLAAAPKSTAVITAYQKAKEALYE